MKVEGTPESILTMPFDCKRQIIQPICWWPVGPKGYNFLEGLLTAVVTFTNHVTPLEAPQCNWILKIRDALCKGPSGLVVSTFLNLGTSGPVVGPLLILKNI